MPQAATLDELPLPAPDGGTVYASPLSGGGVVPRQEFSEDEMLNPRALWNPSTTLMPAAPDLATGTVDQALRTGTFGLSDLAQAGVAATGSAIGRGWDWLTGQPAAPVPAGEAAPSWRSDFTRELAGQRESAAAFARDRPWANLGGTVGGFVPYVGAGAVRGAADAGLDLLRGGEGRLLPGAVGTAPAAAPAAAAPATAAPAAAAPAAGAPAAATAAAPAAAAPAASVVPGVAVDALSPLGAPVGPSVTRAALTNLLGGTAAGGVGGWTSSPDPLDIGASLPNIGKGAAVGGVTGAAAPPLLGSLGYVAGQVARPFAEAINPLYEGGKKWIAGHILNEAAGGMTPAEVEQKVAAAPPGITPPTLGQVTGNQGFQNMEAALPSTVSERTAAVAQSNPAILGHIDTIGATGADPEVVSQQQGAPQLKAIQETQLKSAQTAFQNIDPGKVVTVPGQPVLDRFANFESNLAEARKDLLPPDYKNMLTTLQMRFGDQIPLSEMQAFSSRLGEDASEAYNNQAYNKANVLKTLQKTLFPEGGPEELIPPQQGDAATRLTAARAQWKQYQSTYGEDDAPEINAAITGKTEPSAAFDELIGSPTKGGQAERVQRFLAASQGDPQLQQAARDWFASSMKQAAQPPGSSKVDVSGVPVVSGTGLRKFTSDNAALISSPLFTDQQRDAIRDITNAASTQAQTGATLVPGSRLADLLSPNYKTGLGMGGLGRAAAAVLPILPHIGTMAAGGLIGSHFGETGMGEAGLGSLGAALGETAFGRMFHGPNYPAAASDVVNYLKQARANPTLAAELMRSAQTPSWTTGFGRRVATSPLVPALVLPGTGLAGSRVGNMPLQPGR